MNDLVPSFSSNKILEAEIHATVMVLAHCTPPYYTLSLYGIL